MVVNVSVKRSPIFKRWKDDLYMDKEISILEALTGTSFTIMHLDGKNIPIKGNLGQIITPEKKMRIKGGFIHPCLFKIHMIQNQ